MLCKKEEEQVLRAISKYCYDARLREELSKLVTTDLKVQVVTNCQKLALSEYLERGWQLVTGSRNSIADPENYKIIDALIASPNEDHPIYVYALEWIEGQHDAFGNYKDENYKKISVCEPNAFQSIFESTWSSPFCALISDGESNQWAKSALGGIVEVADGEAFLVLSQSVS